MQKSLFWKISAVILLCTTLVARADVAIPEFRHRVTDTTATLTSAEVSDLDGRLAQLEQQTKVQLALLLVPTTASESIEQYAIRVFEKWKLGQKGIDNGLLFVVAINDRTMKIEVGYGLEGTITDAVSSRILRQSVVPEFKQGNYYQGISHGVDDLIVRVHGNGEDLTSESSWFWTLFIQFLLLVLLGGVAYFVLKWLLSALTTLVIFILLLPDWFASRSGKRVVSYEKASWNARRSRLKREFMGSTLFFIIELCLLMASIIPFAYFLLTTDAKVDGGFSPSFLLHWLGLSLLASPIIYKFYNMIFAVFLGLITLLFSRRNGTSNDSGSSGSSGGGGVSGGGGRSGGGGASASW